MWSFEALRYKSYGPFFPSFENTSSMNRWCASKSLLSSTLCGGLEPRDIKVMNLFSFRRKCFLLWIECVIPESEAMMCTNYGSLPLSFENTSSMNRWCVSKNSLTSTLCGGSEPRDIKVINSSSFPSKIFSYGSNVCFQGTSKLRYTKAMDLFPS